jgi:hypothetical protein
MAKGFDSSDAAKAALVAVKGLLRLIQEKIGEGKQMCCEWVCGWPETRRKLPVGSAESSMIFKTTYHGHPEVANTAVILAKDCLATNALISVASDEKRIKRTCQDQVSCFHAKVTTASHFYMRLVNLLLVHLRACSIITYPAGCLVLQFLQTTSRIMNRFIGLCPVGDNSS